MYLTYGFNPIITECAGPSAWPGCMCVAPARWSLWAMSWPARPARPPAGPSGWPEGARPLLVLRPSARGDPLVWRTRGRGACSSPCRCAPGAWGRGRARSPPCPRQPGPTEFIWGKFAIFWSCDNIQFLCIYLLYHSLY